ncbi:hypothetical protein SAMN05428966_11587 [Massilia sp. PDC64]|nr:hypothetical protein [Massilia sp. PDC64]SDF41785.1 hypothetical protein SAMN05428966_11587 [Massilia sp. PDC64]
MSKEKLLTIGTLAALCVLAAFSMHAKAAGQEGMVVVRDPLTGQLRAPTADELKELRAKTPATAGFAAPRTPATISRRDGARGVRLGEKSMVYEVVTRGPDGKLTSECVQGGDGTSLDHDHGEKTHESR